jgi:DNA-directed RNA polymerase subunit RPC12/RpoP
MPALNLAALPQDAATLMDFTCAICQRTFPADQMVWHNVEGRYMLVCQNCSTRGEAFQEWTD